MPATLSYPGVYIEELPSAVHTITGVATSIAAFVGWAPQGPTDRASLVESWADYQTQFGGLDSHSYLGYSVNQFFANGGQLAYIVRLVGTGAKTASATMDVQLATSSTDATPVTFQFVLFAANSGAWGNSITVSFTVPTKSSRFGLQVWVGGKVSGGVLTGGTLVENFVNLSFASTDPRYVVTVIDSDSQYITFVNPATGVPNSPSQQTTLSDTSTPSTLGIGTSGISGDDGTIPMPSDSNFINALLPTDNVSGLYLLNRVGIFNLLCVPGETDPETISVLQKYCADNRAFAIVDTPQTVDAGGTPIANTPHEMAGGSSGFATPPYAANSALYYPWIMVPDPLFGNRPKLLPPCGSVAGIYAATDASRGVWKAPAGIDAGITGILGLQYVLSDTETGLINTQGVNCLRNFKVYGNVVWGARTLLGNDQIGSQWKYIPIRRLALFIESSLYDGTQWVVFEPNDEGLWGQIRMNVGAFMQGLFLQGAFQGTTPQQAYFVKCDSENNPQASINLGIVNVLVGFAPLYPAEFVVIQIQQIAGQI